MLTFIDHIYEDADRARRLLDQLSNVTVARGATEHEAAAAKKRAQALKDKYGVHELDIPKFLRRKITSDIDRHTVNDIRKSMKVNEQRSYKAAKALKRLRKIDGMKHDRKRPQSPKESILNILKGMFGIGIDKKGKKKKDEDVQDTSRK